MYSDSSSRPDSSNRHSSVSRNGYLSFSKFCRYARNGRIEFLGNAEELIFNESAVVGEFTNGALCDKHNLKEIHHLIKTGRILVNKYDRKRWLYPSDKEESLDEMAAENNRIADLEDRLATQCNTLESPDILPSLKYTLANV